MAAVTEESRGGLALRGQSTGPNPPQQDPGPLSQRPLLCTVSFHNFSLTGCYLRLLRPWRFFGFKSSKPRWAAPSQQPQQNSSCFSLALIESFPITEPITVGREIQCSDWPDLSHMPPQWEEPVSRAPSECNPGGKVGSGRQEG